MGGREQASDGILTSVAHHCVWDGQGQCSTFDSYPVFSTLREDLVPVPYVDFNQQIFTQIVRRMSSYSASIRTDSEAVIADYFEICLPRSILPNFHVTVGSLDDRKTTLNIVLSFDTMPCPNLGDTTVLTTDILWKTSVTYKAVDYVGLKKGLKLRSENPEDKCCPNSGDNPEKKNKRQNEFDLTSSK